MKNYMKLEISASGENESFARSAVAAFALSLNPTLAEISDIKTAVSEAVTNCVVHAYKNEAAEIRKVLIDCQTEGDSSGGILHIRISDFGCGIPDVQKAMEPFYTTSKGEERSGMGFTIMQSFMQDFHVESGIGEGTTVYMSKTIGQKGGVDA